MLLMYSAYRRAVLEPPRPMGLQGQQLAETEANSVFALVRGTLCHGVGSDRNLLNKKAQA